MARRAVALLLLLVASAARAAVIDEAGLFRVSTNDSPPEINRAQLTLLEFILLEENRFELGPSLVHSGLTTWVQTLRCVFNLPSRVSCQSADSPPPLSGHFSPSQTVSIEDEGSAPIACFFSCPKHVRTTIPRGIIMLALADGFERSPIWLCVLGDGRAASTPTCARVSE